MRLNWYAAFMENKIPLQPKNSSRITITLRERKDRLDGVLIGAMQSQNDYPNLKNITRTGLKNLFNKKKIQIKGQNARPSSAIAAGVTYVDILE